MTRGIVVSTVQERADLLAKVSLFEGLDDHELVEVAVQVHLLGFGDGETVVPQGEEGLGFYVIVSGNARVVRDGIDIKTLGPGDFFGEVSILEGEPRNATVIAEGDLRCAGILRAFFKLWLARYPRVSMRIIEEEGRRLQ